MGRELNVAIKPTNRQKVAWKYVLDKTTTELGYGGAGGGGKSWFAAGDFLIYMCITYPGTRWVLGRKELKNLKRTSLITFYKACAEHNLKPDIDFHYNQQDSIIRFWNSSEIILLDLAYMPSDPLYLNLGGLEITGAVVEESNEISVTAINILKTRCGRWRNDEYKLKPLLIETFNPDKGHVYHRYYKPWKKKQELSYRKFVRALVTDNPYQSEAYIQELKRADKITRERLLYGNFEYDDDPNALMETDAIGDLFSNSPEKSEYKYITVDVARFGMDKSVIKVWYGLLVKRVVTIPKGRIDDLVNEVKNIAEGEQIRLSHIIGDEDGVGGGFIDFMKCKGFIGGSSPIKEIDMETGEEKESNYLNLRAQCYYLLADYVNKGKIGIRCESEEIKQTIIEELEQIKGKDVDKDGKRKIVSKNEIKEKLGRSPDYADALMMRLWFEIAKEPEPGVRWM
jgi:phage terminase large subunit